MKFLVDRCVGRRLAEWLRENGHDVLDARSLGADPGDRALLEQARSDDRILITIDMDFGKLVHLEQVDHAGLVRLPDVAVAERIAAMDEVIRQHRRALESRAIVTIRDGRIRISRASVS